MFSQTARTARFSCVVGISLPSPLRCFLALFLCVRRGFAVSQSAVIVLFGVRLSVLCPRFRALFCGPSVVPSVLPSCGLSSFFANFFAHNHSCFSGVVFVAVFWSLLSGQRLGLSGSFFGSSLLWTSSKDFVRCEFVPNFDPILFHKICARIPIPLFRIGISVFGHKKNSAFDRVLFRLDPLRTTASRSRWPFRSFRFSPLPWLFSLAHVLAFRSRKQAVPTSFDLL